MDLEAKVLEILLKNEEPLKTGDIAKLLDVDSKEVSKAIKKLKADGKIISPKRCYYSAQK